MALFHSTGRTKSERLYNAYGRLMYKTAFDILGDSHLSEDAVHESFVRIIKNIDRIDEENTERTKSFLVIISRNVSLDMLRKRKKETETEDIPDPSPGIDEIVINRDTLKRTAEAIRALDPKYRDVLLAVRVHNLSRRETAEMFGISEETVKKRLTRAKEKLKEVIDCEKI